MTLLDQLFQLRDKQREIFAKGLRVVHGKERPLERNRNGYTKWYMHPMLDDTVTKALIVFVQEIPPGSKTGKQKTQGGMVLYVLEGSGTTVLDEDRHEWSQGDVINIPQRDRGVVVQHLNNSSDKVARLLSVQPNLVDCLGVDRGAGFEQIEDAPEK
ncbi:MAG: cupin domain-containing protein [Deltaproteobacteria bacterium]|nr:cupin domain-containing protein [Deltaproteobacteria bacterium]